MNPLERLPWYLNRTLQGDERRAVARALEQQPQWQEELRWMQQLATALQSAPYPAPPALSVASLRRRARWRRMERRLVVLWALSLALAVLLAVWPGVQLSIRVAGPAGSVVRVYRLLPDGSARLLRQQRLPAGAAEVKVLAWPGWRQRGGEYRLEGYAPDGRLLWQRDLLTQAPAGGLLGGWWPSALTVLAVGSLGGGLLVLSYFPLLPMERRNS